MDYLKNFGYALDRETIDKALTQISGNAASSISDDMLKACLSLLDLTTLKTEDTDESVKAFVEKINNFQQAYPNYPLPASLCVFSNFAGVVSSNMKVPVHTTVTSACFPSSQSFLEVKKLECQMAVKAGADEVDVVMPHSKFQAGDYQACLYEISQLREAIDQAAEGRHIVFKVILETGLMKDPDQIAIASFIAMEAGADFIKTSTGKIPVNATPLAAYVMCNCIKLYYKATGRKIGFKPAGGMTTAEDAACYYQIVKTVLGDEWICPELFRFGVSRMGNNLLSALEKETVKYY